MINVFKKRTHLYALTTSALFFLQGIDVSVGEGNIQAVVSSLPAEIVSPKSCESSSSSMEYGPIKCNNKNFTMKGGKIKVKEYGENAVYATGRRANVKLRGLSIEGVTGEGEDGDEEEAGFASAIYAEESAAVELVNTNIKTFATGIEVGGGAVANMKGGEITNVETAVLAGGSSVFLSETAINTSGMALFAYDGAGLTMQFGSLTSPKSISVGGSRVHSSSGASIKLDGVNVKIEAGAQSQEESKKYYDVFLTSENGFVSFTNGRFDSSDAIFLWVDESSSRVPKVLDGYGTKVSNVSLAKVLNVPLKESWNSLYTHQQIAEARKKHNEIYGAHEEKDYAWDNFVSVASKFIAFGEMGSFKISGGIKSSEINVKGSEGVGIAFHKSENQEKGQNEGREQSGNSGDKNVRYVVSLENSVLKVPDGEAIYSDVAKSSVILSKNSELSGDLLLKAQFPSYISVFADDSVIEGDLFIEKGAIAEFYLSGKSEWRLKKGKNEKRGNQAGENGVCVALCIASLNLKDSTLKFIASQNGNDNESYQTLRIGSGSGVVYSSEDGWVHFNVRPKVRRGSDNGQQGSGKQDSDRLFIHGDVSGKTTVHVNAVSGDVEEGYDQNYSALLIRVLGNAEKDSFRLNGEYVTFGSPYQYVLNAYGPFLPPRKMYLNGKLVTSGKIWDFRLENKDYSSISIPDPYRSYVTHSEPHKRKETLVVKDVNEGIVEVEVVDEELEALEQFLEAPEQSGGESSALPSSLPSASSLPVERFASNDLASSGGEDEDDLEDEDDEEGDVITSNDASGTSLRSEESGDPLSSGLGGSGAPNNVENSPSTAALPSSLPSASSLPIERSASNDLAGSGGDDEDNLEDEDDEEGDVITADDASGTSLRSEESGDSLSSGLGGSGAPNNVENSPSTAALPSSLPSASSLSIERSASNDLASSDGEDEDDLDDEDDEEGDVITSNDASGTSLRSEESEDPLSSGLGGSGALNNVENSLSTVALPSSRGNSEVVKPTTLGRSEIAESASALGGSGRKAESVVVSVEDAGGKAVSSQCNDTERNGTKGLSAPYSCSDGKSYTIKNSTVKASNKNQHSVHAKNQNTVIKLEGATISGADSSNDKNNVDPTQLQAVSAVLAEEAAEIVLEQKTTVQSSSIGLEAQRGGKVKMADGTVTAHHVGALAGSGSSVDLSHTKINVVGDLAVAALASDGGKITMDTGTISLAEGVAVRSDSGGNVALKKVSIIATKQNARSGVAEKFGRAAFLLSNNGSVDFAEGHVTTDANALWIRGSDGDIRKGASDVLSSVNHANIESSSVIVQGDKSYGIYFDGTTQRPANGQKQVVNGNSVRKTRSIKQGVVPVQEKTPVGTSGTVTLKKTNFEVLKSIAIYGNNSGGRVSLENGTTLSGDLLLKAKNNSNISLWVDSSVISGGARVDKGSYAKLDLTNGSEWLLSRAVHQNLQAPDPNCVGSCVSFVNLVDSRIEFIAPESGEEYQTLRIGEGKGTVYSASGNSVISFNALLNPNAPKDKQVSDRLLIHGDVSGKTVVSISGSVGENNGSDKIAHSVSIIQVYGKAEKNSFQLDGNYVALGNSPYKYTLRSYSPEMTSKPEHVQQKFKKDGGEFWNFRLENQYVKSGGFDANVVSRVGSYSHTGRAVRSVVPQVSTYLTLPNSVFQAGLMDISNQNKQLERLRTTSSGMLGTHENPALYLYGYGGSYRYASDLSALEYGYGSDASYSGVEAGLLLQTIENADSAVSFGVMGTYGKLSLQPRDVEQSKKSTFDKWTATAYGSLQHDTGFYVDGLLSYGLFKGDVFTLARGKTATLKANPLSVSLTGGQTLATGYEGFVFDPQIQVVYQHLQFNKARDIDGFDIEMGRLDQWVARVGGRLGKTLTVSEGGKPVAFYGKLYFAHGFGGKKSVQFKDAFQLGAFGSSLETGLGVNAQLSQKFALHGDLVYQHKLTKAGFSGISFSGGVRYQF